MFKYTTSAIKNTFDFVKQLIYIIQIAIQLGYIMYIVYRMIYNLGNMIGNIILLSLSISYLLFQIISTRRFYTRKQISQKKTVKWIFKISKYVVGICTIALPVIMLWKGNVNNENATMLITIFMLLGFVLSALLDFVLLLIEKHIFLIKSSIMYDMNIFKEYHEYATKAIKKFGGIDLEKIPNLDNDKVVEKVKQVNQRQEQKKIRKNDFHKKIKQK